MYAVLAVDLDDTLLRDDKTVSPRTMAALQAWQERGGRVVIATGRPPRSTREIPDELHHLPWICYNGALAFHNGDVFYERLLSAADARAAVEAILAIDPNSTVGLEIDDRLYVNAHLEYSGSIFTPDVLAVANKPAAKVIMRVEHFEMVDALLEALPKSVRALVSEKYRLIQIMPADVSKAVALREMLARWTLSPQDAAAFGDDVNDVEMVAEAGLGVAVANAVEEVKVVADCITASNEEDGVALVVEKLLSDRA